MQFVPPTRLEGILPPEERDDDNPRHVPTCPRLDREVKALHALARAGTIRADAAERQINTYLLAPSAPRGFPARWLVLPLADAPHHGMLPDLGQVVHRVLARDPLPCALSAVVEQCVPRFRSAARALDFRDSQPALLTLVMGLVLGLYPGGGVKRPTFAARAALFARLHALLTAEDAAQTDFCRAHEPIVLLACMEYLARALPLHMPVHHQALLLADAATQGFYRRVPAQCDELRQWLDQRLEEEEGGLRGEGLWGRIRTECAARVERMARLKRSSGGGGAHAEPQPHTGHPAALSSQGQAGGALATLALTLPPGGELRYWEAPELRRGAPADEYRLLALALGLHAGALQAVQQELVVAPLPGNLRRMQEAALRRRPGGQRTAYLQSRWFVCARCAIAPQQRATPPAAAPQARLRLDTLTQRLVCVTCLSPDPVCVDLVGRVLQFRRSRHFYLCPACATVQEYQAGPSEQPWAPAEEPDGSHSCCHRPPRRGVRRGGGQHTAGGSGACDACGEAALAAHPPTWRVDHLTGEMVPFSYCQRHAPRSEAARRAVNARQMARLFGSRQDY